MKAMSNLRSSGFSIWGARGVGLKVQDASDCTDAPRKPKTLSDCLRRRPQQIPSNIQYMLIKKTMSRIEVASSTLSQYKKHACPKSMDQLIA